MKMTGFIGSFAIACYGISYLMYRFAGLQTVETSGFYVLICFGVYYILQNGLRSVKGAAGEDRILWAPAVLFAASLVTGFHLDGSLPFEAMGWGDFLNYLLCVLGLTPLLGCLFAAVYRMVKKCAGQEEKAGGKCREGFVVFLLSFVIIFGCWFLVWLAYYPGLWSYDPWQVDQFLEHDYDKHHPLLHTLLLGACYTFGVNGGDANSGVILYDMIQMGVMSGIYAYICAYLYRHVPGRLFRIMTLLFYAFFPVNSILAISPTKDVLFSGLVALCLVLALQVRETAWGRKKLCYLAVLFCAVVLMLLLRSNALYAFVLFIGGALALLLYTWYREKHCPGRYLYICLFAAGCLISFRMADNLLVGLLDAKEGPVREKYSIGCQQFGRVYEMLRASGADKETQEMIASYYDMESAEYDPYLADPMKETMDIQEKGTEREYQRDMVRVLIKYPLESLDAFLYLTQGAWYINDTTSASIYGSGLETRMGYLLTTYAGGYGIVHESRLPWLEALLEKAFSANAYQKLPVVSYLFSPALYFWILVICTVGFFKSRNGYAFILAGFLWCLYLTVLAGPCVLIRYMYPFVACSPLLIGMLLMSMREKYRSEM